MNLLLVDIETAPLAAYVWGLWKQNISPKHVIDTSYVLCWSAKWAGRDKVYFGVARKSDADRTPMLRKIHTLLDRADIVTHFNGKSFDVPVLNREFLIHGMKPPSPYKQIDLYQLFKRRFRFESNRLDNIGRRLGIGEKVTHEGFQLWIDCMAGDKDAWKKMEAYNRQDVILLEKLYQRALPWIDNHPVVGALEDNLCCTNCGSEEIGQRGWSITTVMKYRRYCCRKCGTWFRGNKSVSLRGEDRYVPISTR